MLKRFNFNSFHDRSIVEEEVFKVSVKSDIGPKFLKQITEKNKKYNRITVIFLKKIIIIIYNKYFAFVIIEYLFYFI
jgi:uncharacterized protein YqfB (UPF0267 family)